MEIKALGDSQNDSSIGQTALADTGQSSASSELEQFPNWHPAKQSEIETTEGYAELPCGSPSAALPWESWERAGDSEPQSATQRQLCEAEDLDRLGALERPNCKDCKVRGFGRPKQVEIPAQPNSWPCCQKHLVPRCEASRNSDSIVQGSCRTLCD